MESLPDLEGGGGTTLKFCDLTETTGMLRLLQILILMPCQCFLHCGNLGEPYYSLGKPLARNVCQM